MKLEIHATPLRGLFVVERAMRADERGSLSRLFSAAELVEAGWVKPVAQINQSATRAAGTVRGLHFQRAPHAEMKLVSCLHGAVWDVAVDLRAGSPTLGRWHAEELSADNRRAMLIPEGFAHGFQSLTDHVELVYCHSAAYAAEAEAGLHPLDSALAIAWPLPIAMMSQRDANHPDLPQGFEGFHP